MGWLAADHPALADCPPMPPEFAPRLQHTDKVVLWRGTFAGSVPLEVGFRHSQGDAEAKTRLAVWHLQHLSKMGRHDLLAGARVDRHSRRPKSKPAPSLAPTPPRPAA